MGSLARRQRRDRYRLRGRSVVVDVDPAHGGRDSLEQLLADRGPLPETHLVHTGGGGLHLYFAHPGGLVRNQAGRLGPGIDVRGDGGYVLAPPSRHISGRPYQPGNDHRQLAAVPDWLRTALQPPPRATPVPPVGVRPSTAWADAALSGELASLRDAGEGTRNHTLNRSAYRLGQIVATGALDEPLVTTALLHTAQDIGLGDREAARTIQSGLTAGQHRPRGPTPKPTGPGLGLS